MPERSSIQDDVLFELSLPCMVAYLKAMRGRSGIRQSELSVLNASPSGGG